MNNSTNSKQLLNKMRRSTDKIIFKELVNYLMESKNFNSFYELEKNAICIIKSIKTDKKYNIGVLRQSSLGGSYFTLTYRSVDNKFHNIRYRVFYENDKYIIKNHNSKLTNRGSFQKFINYLINVRSVILLPLEKDDNGKYKYDESAYSNCEFIPFTLE